MVYLWDQPYFFLLLCFGGYFYLRASRAFSETPCRHLMNVVFGAPFSRAARGRLAGELLLDLPNDVSPLSWLLLLSTLRQGGAGGLFWYAVFSVLWMKPLGALAGLWSYYRRPEERHVDLATLLTRARRRRALAPQRGAGGVLRVVQLALLGCLLCASLLFLTGSGPGWGTERAAAYLVPSLPLWLLCRRGGDGAKRGVAVGFLVFLGVGLLANLPNLVSVLTLVFRDAFQWGTILFPLAGAGLLQGLRAGAQLSAGTLLTQGLSGRAAAEDFPHPGYQAVYAQLRALLGLAVQLVLGLLLLCHELVPQDNGWIQLVLHCFLVLFAMEFLVRNLQVLRVVGRVRRLVVGIGAVAAFFLSCGALPGPFLPLVLGVVWAASLCVIFLLLFDSSWFFALMEHFRDTYVWRVEAYPKIAHHDQGT